MGGVVAVAVDVVVVKGSDCSDFFKSEIRKFAYDKGDV